MRITIREVRKQKNITIMQLEKLSGVSRAEISDIETGKKIPSGYTLCAIAKALQVTICTIISCDDN